MIEIYNTLLYQPIFNLLIWLYNVVPGNNIGLAIILLTIIIKVLLYPFSLQSIKAQRAMQEIQPKLEALKKKYKDNKEQLSLEMIKLYKEQKVNPLSSCLPMLIQLPFLIAVFQVFRKGLSNGSFDILYSFVANPGVIDATFLGMNLKNGEKKYLLNHVCCWMAMVNALIMMLDHCPVDYMACGQKMYITSV